MIYSSRRRFIQWGAGIGAASLGGFPYIALGASHKIVIIGGGVGGTTAAGYLKKLDPSLEVTLIEAMPYYYTGFMSNEVVVGERPIDSIKFDYEVLIKMGVRVVIDVASQLNPEKKEVITQGGAKFPFDRCIVSPGIDFKWETIAGYNAQIAEKIPHAWKAGPQTVTLRQQIESLTDGEPVIMIAPPPPYRCPPGPYERASLIAMYLKANKPKSKVIILDMKDNFSKKELFEEGWRHFNYKIEWIPSAEDGVVSHIDPIQKAVYTKEFNTEYKGGVINIIPPQKAGRIAHVADLVDDSGWCPINRKTFESQKHPDIYVIGDAASTSEMPKAAHAANVQGKICAMSILASLRGESLADPTYINVCYSLVEKSYGLSVASVYRYEKSSNLIKTVSMSMSPPLADLPDPGYRKREVEYAHGWFQSIIKDSFLK